MNDPCPVCASQRQRQLYKSTFIGGASEASAYFLAHRTATAHGRVVQCAECGFVMTSPRFSDDDYDRIYSEIPKPHAGLAAFDPAKIARFRRLTGIVRKLVPRGARLLDFGCADGAFLRELDDPAASGFEIGPDGQQEAGPSSVYTGRWSEFAGSELAPAGQFAAVTAIDVLEHLPRLAADIGLLRSVLAPGGLLFASVPNIKSRIARVMGRRWNMILLEHLWYFSPATFNRMMAQHGFETVRILSLPFDAPLAHVATRLGQTFGMRGVLVPRGLARLVVPVPAGIMLGIFRAI